MRRGHAVFMQNMQWISAPVHVDPRYGPPTATDQKQAIPLRPHLLNQIGDGCFDVGLAPFVAALDALQFERPKI